MAIPAPPPTSLLGRIHGLSTPYHLALQLKATGKGGRNIIILDKPGFAPAPRALPAGSFVITISPRHARTHGAPREHLGERPETYSYHPWGTCRSAANPCGRCGGDPCPATGDRLESVFIEGAGGVSAT
ncbi:MAG: hypothetical protein CM15mP103_12160 [Gammaproteobacteria bacterium]|nr:MAG: hypothetical protein CM15mP103_12160 [Gammaproteobacteria bacterium]